MDGEELRGPTGMATEEESLGTRLLYEEAGNCQ